MPRRRVLEGEDSVRIQSVIGRSVRDRIEEVAEEVTDYEGNVSALLRDLVAAFSDGAIQVRKSYPALREAARLAGESNA